MHVDIFVAIIGLLGALVGSTLGCALGYFFSKRQSKNEFNANLFFKYQNIAQELVDILQGILSLSFYPIKHTKEELKSVKENLSSFYFKYYLILPQSVLEEIQCLHLCLHYNGHRIFMSVKGPSGNTIKHIDKKEELESLVKDSFLTHKTNKKAILRFHELHPERTADIFLRYQARHLITVLNENWNIKKLHSWKNTLGKETIAKKEKKYNTKIAKL